jgi:nitronate monooxygenase
MTFDFSQLQCPVIQAPMAGGINTPALAAAVANAGGVGSFGFAYSSPEKISADLRATQALTTGPLNANFFVFQPVALPDAAQQAAALAAFTALGLPEDCVLRVPQAPFYPDLDSLLVPVWQHRPALLTFHFGIPPASVLQQAKALEIAVGITATSLAEAQQIEAAGADFIVAQGIEAGGHRGTFEPEGDADTDWPLDTLLSVLTAHCRLPIVAAGAVMDGDDIHRVLRLGAVAAQMGTAFLCCDESGASPAHQAFIRHEHARGTAFTRGFSGRRAQGIANQFMTALHGQTTLPFPIQNTLTGPIRQRAVQRNDGEHQSLWAGTAYRQAQALPAAVLMQYWSEQLQACRRV